MNWEYAYDMLLKWENEDELPELSKDIYDALFPLSRVDGVRLFPYILIEGKKIYLATLEE